MKHPFPGKLGFLFQKHRYKVLYGGRGGTKSWGIARALLALGADRPLRILCVRETQKSIADSVHALLKEQIQAMGLGWAYRVEKATIIGINGTQFIFSGLKNATDIKSYEGVDICWVEEAQVVSKASFDILVPTIRKEGSEIWISFNPGLDTDEVWKRFVVNKPTGAYVCEISYLDNPWFPSVLDIERRDMERLDPAGYANVWLGQTRSSVEGAIYATELQAALDSGRICHVARDRTRPVDTYWDLGFGDKTAIFFAQAVDGWYRLVDYEENNGRTIEWWMIQLQNKGYLYGVDWLPHDAVDTIIHAKLAGGDKSRSIEMLMRAAGRNVRVAPKIHVTDRINAGRTIFPQCQFDQEACTDGLQALRRYQWGPINKQGVTGRSPLHNDASHGADAFQTFAVCAKQPRAPQEKKRPQPAQASAWA